MEYNFVESSLDIVTVFTVNSVIVYPVVNTKLERMWYCMFKGLLIVKRKMYRRIIPITIQFCVLVVFLTNSITVFT